MVLPFFHMKKALAAKTSEVFVDALRGHSVPRGRILRNCGCIHLTATSTCEPFVSWETLYLVESLKFFKQQCELFFSVKGIAENKQVDHIVLLSGKKGLRRYNSWSFGNDANWHNPAVIWESF